MKKNSIIIGIVLLIMLLCTACGNKTFMLEEKYYGESKFVEIDNEDYDKLISDKESFAIFIYQPLCAASSSFKEVLTEYSNTKGIVFYKMTQTKMKESKLGETLKYYPSLVIVKDGKVVDYLDANSSDDTRYYQNAENFNNWFTTYVELKEYDGENVYTTTKNINHGVKIDAKLDNVTYDNNKVNIYFFWGNGCPHCEEGFKFLDSISKEYGKYFKLNKFEVWENEDNAKLMEQFANKMGDEISGVPYIVIGNRTFKGFGEKHKEAIKDAIKEQYKDSYDVYFENK